MLELQPDLIKKLLLFAHGTDLRCAVAPKRLVKRKQVLVIITKYLFNMVFIYLQRP